MLKPMRHPSFVATFWLALSSGTLFVVICNSAPDCAADLIVRMSALGAKALCTVVVMAWQLMIQRRTASSSSRPFDPLLPVSTSAPAPGSQSPLMTEHSQAAPSPHSPHPSADSDDVGSAAHAAGDPTPSAEAGEGAGSNRWRLSAIHSSALHKRLNAVTALHSCVSTLWRQLCATIVWLAFYSDGLVDFGFLPAAYVSLKIVTILVSLTTIGRIVKAAAKILWRPLAQVGQAATTEQIQRCGSDDCSICQDGFQNPRHLTCGHVFCADCLTEWCVVLCSSALEQLLETCTVFALVPRTYVSCLICVRCVRRVRCVADLRLLFVLVPPGCLGPRRARCAGPVSRPMQERANACCAAQIVFLQSRSYSVLLELPAYLR